MSSIALRYGLDVFLLYMIKTGFPTMLFRPTALTAGWFVDFLQGLMTSGSRPGRPRRRANGSASVGVRLLR